MADIYRNRSIARFLGSVSFLLLLVCAVYLVIGNWTLAFYCLILSIVAAYLGYRAAGGRDNPELARGKWEKQSSQIDVVSDPVASWPAKIEALFNMTEEKSGRDYSEALRHLQFRRLPGPVQLAYDRACETPTQETWNALKQALIDNPPK